MPTIHIGNYDFGRTNAIGPDAVYTEFFIVGLPLVANKSAYGRATGHPDAIPLPLNSRSVILGYMRSWGSIVFALLLTGCLYEIIEQGETWLYGLVASIFLGWGYVLFFWDQVPKTRVRQRRLMCAYLKTTVDPKDLDPKTAEKLLALAKLDQLTITQARQAMTGTDPLVLRPFYVAAEYQSTITKDAAWAQLTADLWQRLAPLSDQQFFSPINPAAAAARNKVARYAAAPAPPASVTIRQGFRYPPYCCMCFEPTQVIVTQAPGTAPASPAMPPPTPIPFCPECAAVLKKQTRKMQIIGALVGLPISLPVAIWLVKSECPFEHPPVEAVVFVDAVLTALGVLIAAVVFGSFAKRPYKVSSSAKSPGWLTVTFLNGSYAQFIDDLNAKSDAARTSRQTAPPPSSTPRA